MLRGFSQERPTLQVLQMARCESKTLYDALRARPLRLVNRRKARIDSTFRSRPWRLVQDQVLPYGTVTLTRFDGTLAPPEASTLSTMYT